MTERYTNFTADVDYARTWVFFLGPTSATVANVSLQQQIVELIERISREGRLAANLWPADLPIAPADLGLRLENDELFWPQTPQTIDLERVRSGLPALSTALFPAVDSTNTRLLEEGAGGSIAGRLYLAEFQYGGRGRRGRSWLSPYGRNLSMSLGAATERRLSELGGLSVVVGLGLADALEGLGLAGVQLKWPNDVLVDDAKLCGILVELVQRGAAVEYVVGIGVNVELTDAEIAAIGQPVTDLRRCGVEEDRTGLVIALIDKVHAHLQLYEAEGFAPFVRAFNALHKFHDQTCSILQGDNIVTGTVTGIGENGELILRNADGEHHFHGGEVSLRPAE